MSHLSVFLFLVFYQGFKAVRTWHLFRGIMLAGHRFDKGYTVRPSARRFCSGA